MSLNNNVWLCGKVKTAPEYSHCVYEEKFYSFYIAIQRLSGYTDILPVTAAKSMAERVCLGGAITVMGQLRSYNKLVDGVSRLILTVFAKEITKELSPVDNRITLDGFICKPVIYRTTPFNREIADILLAINRQYGKSDYIPCIAWGQNARLCRPMEVGDRVRVLGRIQSREYEKVTDDGCVCVRTAYEVSISSIELIK